MASHIGDLPFFFALIQYLTYKESYDFFLLATWPKRYLIFITALEKIVYI